VGKKKNKDLILMICNKRTEKRL